MYIKTLVNCLWFDHDIHDAISMPRLHHQLYPEFLFAETRFPITILHDLEKYGHKVRQGVVGASVAQYVVIVEVAFHL